MPDQLIIVSLVVAAFCLGIAVRDYYDNTPAAPPVSKFPNLDTPLERTLRVAAWLEGPWHVPVGFTELPEFVQRRAIAKEIARFTRARDTFRPVP